MDVAALYLKNPNFPYRYISPQVLEKYLCENLSDYVSPIGVSTLGKTIYRGTFGKGPIRVLAWSQMHGNESNATHAMLDLWEMFLAHPVLKDSIWDKISLDFIFQLNPDGSEAWTRRNALDIDLNRDFLKRASKELPLLKSLVEEGGYDYGLNLHEQRTIFSTDGKHPATLSFLAPSEEVTRAITPTRKKAMAVISAVRKRLERWIPDQIGRYSDEFYPSSTGDNFTKLGLPTILFEGGHFLEDYQREGTRKYYTLALYEALRAIAELNGSTQGWEEYASIPKNKESHYDVIYRNVKLHTDFDCVLDVAIQYKEIIKEGDSDISFVPIVVEVGDCSRKKGWKEVDCTGRFFKSANKYPKLDAPQNFEIL
ncbi:peptidase M14 [Bergeyella sp. RCAD1439]|uniref:peptidase M14 n=1 Tax=Bergeyella anatis TaxID=3113737 RepID=UPI002E174994|nr:peptidase M14 [Bergeyella sp. RCAD1439]